jgi:hypothetical protein
LILMLLCWTGRAKTSSCPSGPMLVLRKTAATAGAAAGAAGGPVGATEAAAGAAETATGSTETAVMGEGSA